MVNFNVRVTGKRMVAYEELIYDSNWAEVHFANDLHERFFTIFLIGRWYGTVQHLMIFLVWNAEENVLGSLCLFSAHLLNCGYKSTHKSAYAIALAEWSSLSGLRVLSISTWFSVAMVHKNIIIKCYNDIRGTEERQHCRPKYMRLKLSCAFYPSGRFLSFLFLLFFFFGHKRVY